MSNVHKIYIITFSPLSICIITFASNKRFNKHKTGLIITPRRRHNNIYVYGYMYIINKCIITHYFHHNHNSLTSRLRRRREAELSMNKLLYLLYTYYVATQIMCHTLHRVKQTQKNTFRRVCVCSGVHNNSLRCD